jgi:hypothetical protein
MWPNRIVSGAAPERSQDRNPAFNRALVNFAQFSILLFHEVRTRHHCSSPSAAHPEPNIHGLKPVGSALPDAPFLGDGHAGNTPSGCERCHRRPRPSRTGSPARPEAGRTTAQARPCPTNVRIRELSCSSSHRTFRSGHSPSRWDPATAPASPGSCYESRFISGLSYSTAFSSELWTSIFPL